MTHIPKKLKDEILQDQAYKTCMLFEQGNHQCAGRITLDHAVIFAGKQLQKKFAIIGICEKGHGVDNFQDGGDTSKEVRLWIALNRASDDELIQISKATSYIREKERLNAIYGVWVQKYPEPGRSVPRPLETKKNWYLIPEETKKHLECIRAFNREIHSVNRMPMDTITAIIEGAYLEIKDQVMKMDEELYKKIGFDK